MKHALIPFFTKTGTTGEIAREIEKILRDGGAEARALPLSEVTGLDGYDAVILGAPINAMRWVPEAVAFAAEHRDALRALPTAVFAVSYMHGAARPGWNRAIEKGVRSAADAIGARASAIFAGRIASPMPGFARVLFGLPRSLPLDRVDLEAVRAWARELAGTLGLSK